MKKKNTFFGEFKEFISRGNVIDMAVGIIIGSAFTAIVTSVVGDIITPLIGVITGGVDFASLAVTIGEASIAYGALIQNVINFVIIALCVFAMVKVINRFRRKEEEAPKAPPAPSKEEVLLTEIRDLLKKQVEGDK